MVGQTLRNFRIVSEIGEGGMGVVYLAEHIKPSKEICGQKPIPLIKSGPSFSQSIL